MGPPTVNRIPLVFSTGRFAGINFGSFMCTFRRIVNRTVVIVPFLVITFELAAPPVPKKLGAVVARGLPGPLPRFPC